MLTPTCEESANSEDQTLDLNPDETRASEKKHAVRRLVKNSVVPEPNSDGQIHVSKSQDHKGYQYEDSGSTRNVESKPKKKLNKSKNHTNNEKNYSNTYTREKSLKCDTCGKSFKYKSTLHRHLRIHTGEKLHNCETCGRNFRLGHHLKAHMRSHTVGKRCQT
ncbi:hypothetical protein PAMA_018025 [Pampus argenteus]